MKYGIICAMQEEIELLRADLTEAAVTRIAEREFCAGKLYGKDVVLVMSRIGKVASASTATTLIDRYHPDCVIFCGTAGGDHRSLNVGDAVVGDRLVQHDLFTGVDHFRIPLLDVSYFKADQMLSSALLTAVDHYMKYEMKQDIPGEYLEEFNIISPKVQMGTIASGDQFICDNNKNAWLSEHIENLQCVEMEGAAVAQVCYEFGVPFAVLRIISDSANDDSNIDFMRFVEKAACHFTRGSLKAFLLKA